MGKKKEKLDSQLLEWMVDAFDEQTDHARLAEFARYFDRPESSDAYARAVLALHSDGIIASYLRAVLGEATDNDVEAITAFAITTPAGRTQALAAVKLVADRIAVVQLAEAVANIETLIPYDPFVLEHTTDHDRVAFAARHRSLLADASGEREAPREKAALALTKLTGPDRVHAALWLELEGKHLPKQALLWAQAVLLGEPSVSALHAAFSIGEEIDDDTCRERMSVLTLKRAVAILAVAVERDWGGVALNIAKGAPATFHDEAGFAAFLAALEAPATHRGVLFALCSADARYWGPALDDAQAAIVAQHVVKLLDNEDEAIVKHVANSCHYVANKGCMPVWREALAGKLSADSREAIYSAVYQTNDVSAEDLLIDRLFLETEDRRHAIFAYNERVPADRQAEVLARTEKQHSFDALWMFVGCQVNWAHRPRTVLAGVELALQWPDEGVPQRRAFIMSSGVTAAIELHRYDLARQCLAALGKRKQVDNPCETDEEDSVLEDKDAPLDELRSKKLDAKDQKLLDSVAKARAANQPRAADNDDLAALAKTQLGWMIHRDEDTHEVWFFDRELEFFYYDGFGIAAPPFEQKAFAAVHGYDLVIPGLVAFCVGWKTVGRSYHAAKSDFRYLLRSGNKLLLRFSGTTEGTSALPFGITFPSEQSAAHAFAAFDANPLEGFTAEDPFYLPGKRGGTRVFEYGNSSEYGFVASNEFYWGNSKWGPAQTLASHEAAVAAFDEAEADALRRGAYPRKMELEVRIRPLDDMLLAKWLRDHATGVDSFAELESAIAGLDLDYKLTIGAPATDEELAAYDATLPHPVPDEMRAMWKAVGSVKWKVGDDKARLLSPAEVVAGRDKHRKLLAETIKPKLLPGWGVEFLDAFILGDDEVLGVYDVRQHDKDTWRDHGNSYGSSLQQVVGKYLVERFVDALIAEYPELKKLNYGQKKKQKNR